MTPVVSDMCCRLLLHYKQQRGLVYSGTKLTIWQIISVDIDSTNSNVQPPRPWLRPWPVACENSSQGQGPTQAKHMAWLGLA